VSTSISHPSRRSVTRAFFVIAIVFCTSFAFSGRTFSAQVNDHKLRDLSGTVTSPSHEPLKGAVVELQEGDGAAIRSYITGQNGEYHFNRLNSDADYKVWVVFRTRHSKSKEISKFDDHLDKVIDFTVETF
jgi:hypothetical protein